MTNDSGNKCPSNLNYNEIAADYSNVSALDNRLKNYHDALIDGMHSLALYQLTFLNSKLDGKKNAGDMNNIDNTVISSNSNNLVLSYYNLGVQQEFLKRFEDSTTSFNKSQSCVKINSTDKNLINKLNSCNKKNPQKNQSLQNKIGEMK
jgi:hypothetical protein